MPFGTENRLPEYSARIENTRKKTMSHPQKPEYNAVGSSLAQISTGGGDGMEDVYLSADYRSAWRPLKRENDLSAVNSPSDAGTSVKDTKIVDTFTNVNEMTLHNDVLQKVSEISADLDRLDRRLQEQDEKISNLLSLLEGKEGTGKKSVFGQQRK